MKIPIELHAIRAVIDESGQVLPWMGFLMAVFVGMGGLTIDVGRGYVSHRELQASTDAAALAGAYEMSLSTATVSSVKTFVQNYSSASSGENANPNLPDTVVTPTLECLTTLSNQGILCNASPTGNNAIQVTQSVTIPTYFVRALSVLGIQSSKTLTITATSTAAMRGASNAQYNVAILVDTTSSMSNNDTDAGCGNTRIYCALEGVQTLLQSLSPCTASSTSTNCSPFDSVSLFTFPNVRANTAANDVTCPTSNPTILSYSTPTAGATWSAPTGSAATYQITSYLSDYSSTNKAGGSLSSSSDLAIATGGSGKGNCKGLQTPGGDGTYYAGAIYAAQSSLIAAQSANPGSLNAMIILSDGDASAKSSKISGTLTTTGIYPSAIDQCQQAITAAQAATAAGTTVYSIAYGASSSGCSTDTSGALKGLSPCTAMRDLASTSADFYSDATASQNKGQCTSAINPNLTLDQIFKQVATQFTVSRLIPNSTT